ncbi:enoyl-CoA hydratase-related protein [Achromobacter aloeverae]|uniref:2-(1,2-epoxy-1,2-dihydrophenyl)acetyl-CoA isomerase n=1 Tax=Achromobacter aloeverae TaxID=1750518 RepID=A0A4Q1HQ30_9BURK|nr:enoyl-CoA hydratase-related protein [Achromobacter aloeverae]RXN92791.1 2-(1,2-epoxy-1,2-dihydrophenyl)acetyl-CoA isomerase [Achromobacter aloeverae]
MSGSYEQILFALADGVARITLNRPERLNSLTDVMRGEISRALDEARASAGLRGVVITGAGRGFCAGQDLADRKPLPEGQRRDLSEGLRTGYRPLMERLRSMPAPVVCVVNGVAAGAGMSFALACDVVFAAESAKFVQAFSKIGLVPDMGGSWFLPRLVGEGRAMGMALFGETLTARQAADCGLIWRCVPDADLQQTLDEVSATLAGAPTLALAATKQALRASGGNTLMQQFDLEAELQRAMGYTDDYLEGMRAFAEKRPPRFTGR